MTLTDHLQPLLDKRFPAALVAAFLLQLAGALFWAGMASQRLSTLETTLAADAAAIHRVAVLEEQVSEIKTTLDRIEGELDRAQTQQKRN
jgi:uncharacterized coiled-coil protein SlyX